MKRGSAEKILVLTVVAVAVYYGYQWLRANPNWSVPRLGVISALQGAFKVKGVDASQLPPPIEVGQRPAGTDPICVPLFGCGAP